MRLRMRLECARHAACAAVRVGVVSPLPDLPHSHDRRQLREPKTGSQVRTVQGMARAPAVLGCLHQEYPEEFWRRGLWAADKVSS